MKRKKSLLKNAINEQPPLPEPRGLSSELNLDGLEEFLTENTPKKQETTEPQKVKELQPNQISFERAGLKVVEPRSIGEIIDLLSQYVCDVEFTRVSPPRGTRILRCTLNERYLGRRLEGMGPIGDLIKIWDIDHQAWKSFYAKTVKKISYDANPYEPGSNT
jgi:hypothetical protein